MFIFFKTEAHATICTVRRTKQFLDLLKNPGPGYQRDIHSGVGKPHPPARSLFNTLIYCRGYTVKKGSRVSRLQPGCH
jgi:hypothetical protein